VWRVNRVASTGSTNADLAALAAEGEPEGYVLVADQQTAGRGRLGRSWESPPGSSLSVSFLLRPVTVPSSSWPWLPLLVGVAAADAVDAAVADAVHAASGLDVGLKWPNDVLRDGAKLAGILVERTETSDGPAAVAGIGMNITAAPEGAASLADVGVSRDDVLDSLMSRLAERYRAWRGNPSAPELATAYRARCDTIGREIQAHLPGGETLTGRAIEIDDAGRLVIETEGRTRAIGAGEVVHVRPVSGA
jgi:BirA family biotin operon repressor/biotin-[acetyl-CoA-carboxylase] ligase